MKFISAGGRLYIVIGVVTLAVIFSMMTVNWTRMIYTDEEANSMLFGVLISSISIGILSILIPKFSTCCYSRDLMPKGKSDSGYKRLRVAALILFGFCNLAHCVLFILKHASSSSECSHRNEGIAYNILSIIYTILLMIEISVCKVLNESVCHRLLSICILFANFSFWLDTIFSESGSIFNHGDDIETTPLNHTNITTFCNYTKLSMLLIKNVDPVLSTGTVEFAVITVDMIFSNQADSHNSNLDSTPGAANKVNTQTEDSDSLQKVKKLVLLLFGIASFVLFAISIVGFFAGLSDDEESDKEKESLTLSIFFESYIITSSIIKLTMLVCVTWCTVLSWQNFKYTFSVEGLILMMSCFGNIIYHMFYLFAIWKSYKDKKEEGVDTYLGFAYFDNIVSIFVAAVQTIFILAIENKVSMSNNRHKNTVYYVCMLLAIINAGLWASDSFGESRLPILSIIIKRNYSQTFWIIFTKLVLPITIFFRIHSGLILLKMHCYSDSHGPENSQVEMQNANNNSSSQSSGSNTSTT